MRCVQWQREVSVSIVPEGVFSQVQMVSFRRTPGHQLSHFHTGAQLVKGDCQLSTWFSYSLCFKRKVKMELMESVAILIRIKNTYSYLTRIPTVKHIPQQLIFSLLRSTCLDTSTPARSPQWKSWWTQGSLAIAATTKDSACSFPASLLWRPWCDGESAFQTHLPRALNQEFII